MKIEILNYLEDRFGINSDVLGGYEFYEASKGRVFMGPKLLDVPTDITSVGLMVFRIGNGIKPSSMFFQIFGKYVKKNFIELTKEDAISYIRGEDLDDMGGSDGYVLVKYEDYPMGCGFLKDGHLKNMLPKAKRMEIKLI